MSMVNVVFFTSIQEAVPRKVWEPCSACWVPCLGGHTSGQLVIGTIAVALPVGGVITIIGIWAAIASCGFLLTSCGQTADDFWNPIGRHVLMDFALNKARRMVMSPGFSY